MVLARAARLAAPAAAVGIARAAAMGLSLGAVTLTFYTLGPAAFTLFNLVMFYVALGGAVAAPLNRAFWAGNSAERYGPAWLSSAGVAVVIIGAGLALSPPAGSPVERAALVIAGIAYAAARGVERYGYGRLLTMGEGSRSATPIILFALSDAAVAAIMLLTANQSLFLRLIAPAIVFLLVLALTRRRSLLAELRPNTALLSKTSVFVREQLASPTGLKVIVFGTVVTLASASDRLLAAHLPIHPPAFGAAYLLAVSYGIALQTLSGFLFDLARIHVFHEGAWKPEARHYSLMCAGAVIGLNVLVLASYPLLLVLRLLPESVSFVLWAGILVRSASLSLVFILNVDHYQKGRFAPSIRANLLILLGGAAAFMLLNRGYTQIIAGAAMALSGGLVSVVLAWRLSRRIGQ